MYLIICKLDCESVETVIINKCNPQGIIPVCNGENVFPSEGNVSF